jgi:predicted Zn-dependent protease
MKDQALIRRSKWELSEERLLRSELGDSNLSLYVESFEILDALVEHYRELLKKTLSGWEGIIQNVEILVQSKVEKLYLQMKETIQQEQGLLIRLIVEGKYRLVPVLWQFSAKEKLSDNRFIQAIEEEILPEIRAARWGEYLLERASFPIILDPWLASQLIHECIGHSSEADNYLNYMKPNGYELGMVWTDYPLQVYDDPTMVGMRGSYDQDHEGSSSFCTQLLEDGVWTGLLHNRETAQMLGEKRSCHGRRVIGNERIQPRMSVTYAGAGKESFEEMIQIEKGLYCVGTWGGGSNGLQFLIRPAYGIYIEDGRMTNRIVRGFDIRGNKLEAIRQIEAVGKDVKFFNPFFGCDKNGQNNLPVAHGAPHIRLKKAHLVPIGC